MLCPLPECNLSYANGIWLADLDADAWKLKVHHGFVQPLGTVGSLALFTPPRDEAGREKWQRHQNYAGHILSEEWQKQPNGTYRWVPEGYRSGHLRSQRANHYLDAIHRSSAKRLNRTGGEPFTMRSSLVLPYGTDKTRPAETLKERKGSFLVYAKPKTPFNGDSPDAAVLSSRPAIRIPRKPSASRVLTRPFTASSPTGLA